MKTKAGIVAWFFGITGFVADVFSIIDHFKAHDIKIVSQVNIPVSLVDTPELSLLFIEYGLLGVSIFIWYLVDEKAGIERQGKWWFLCVQAAVVVFPLFLYFVSYDKQVFSLEFLIWVGISLIGTYFIGRSIFQLISS